MINAKRVLPTLLLTLLWTCIVLSTTANAQTTADLYGTVRDQSGAPVPDATVTLANLQTGFTESRKTSIAGAYALLYLPIGKYQLAVEKNGFRKYVQTGITFAVNDKVTLDVALELGQLSSSVTVRDSAPLVEAQTGTLRGLVDNQRMLNLPLNGRDMTALVAIQAGAIKGDDRGYDEGVAYQVNGARQNGVYYLLDSGYNTDTYRNYSGAFPNPDAIEEFSVQRSNFSAEYSNATGAVVSVVTKSGTNEFHGSMFEFLRNRDLNARNFFEAQRDSLKQNQFGASAGGPILKDKLFFFVSYQGSRLRSDPALSRQFLPTAAERTGDFSAVTTPIIDPLTSGPFPNNQIPQNRINPVTVAFLPYIPTPATSDGERWSGSPDRTGMDEWTGKIDLTVKKHRLSGKVFRDLEAQSEDYAALSKDITSTTPALGLNYSPYLQTTLNDLYTFSPHLMNSATMAFRSRISRSGWSKFPITFEMAGVQGISDVGNQKPMIYVDGGFHFVGGHGYYRHDVDLHWNDTVTQIWGRHNIKYGFEAIRSHDRIENHFMQHGEFYFTGDYTGTSMADFMLGYAYEFDQGGGEYKNNIGTRYGLFVQDDVRVSPDLTLNVGLRWDPMFPFHDGLGRMQCLRAGQQSTRFQNAPLGYLSGGDPGCPVAGFNSYTRAISPRLGFAWRPWGAKTVIRAAGGLFWNPQFSNVYNNFVNAAPFSPQVTLYAVKLENPYARYTNPFPPFAPFNPSADAPFYLPLGTFGSFASNYRPSYMETLNFTLERQFGSSVVGRASYVANLGRHLSYADEINYGRHWPGNSSDDNLQDRRPYHDFNGINMAFSDLTSSYNSLQLSAERRMNSNVSLEISYVWSKAIGYYNNDADPGSDVIPIPGNLKANRSLANFDVPHRLVLSYVWVLPTLKDLNALARHVLGGWQTSGIWVAQSGTPFSIVSGRDNSYSAMGYDFADLVGDPFLPTDRPRGAKVAEYFNTAAFGPNALGTFGSAPPNLLRGPGLFGADLALIRSFGIRERWNLQFRSEFFNAFNRPNFGQPYNEQRTADRFGQIESAGDPRRIQLALKLLF